MIHRLRLLRDLLRDLIACKLFGYDSGAFTGAKRNGTIGKFALANGALFPASEMGQYMTGQNLVIEKGRYFN